MKTSRIVLFAVLFMAGGSLVANAENDNNRSSSRRGEQRTESRVERKHENKKVEKQEMRDEKPFARQSERQSDHRNIVQNRGNNHQYGDNRNAGRGFTFNRVRAERDVYFSTPRPRIGFSLNLNLGRNEYNELARIETNNIAMALDLSDRQVDKIYRINLKYLNRRPGNHLYAMERREREIRRVLDWEQEEAYNDYLKDMNSDYLCGNYDQRR
jgi:hypothetical protein